MKVMEYGDMHQEINNQDFRRAVDYVIIPALSKIGFQLEESKSDRLWDSYFFRRGKDRVCIYYLEKDCEFNFMISRSGGEIFNNPGEARSGWVYGTLALEQARGRSLSKVELAEMEGFLDRGSDEIARLFADLLVEIFVMGE